MNLMNYVFTSRFSHSKSAISWFRLVVRFDGWDFWFAKQTTAVFENRSIGCTPSVSKFRTVKVIDDEIYGRIHTTQ